MALLIDAPDHPIESVTIYKSNRAEIVRRFSLQLALGQNKIEIKSLPGTIDTQSIRISGLGHARLHDVVCLLNQRKRPGSTDHSEVIKELRKQRGLLEQEKHVLQQQSRILSDYAGTLKGEHVNPADVVTFLNTYEEHAKSKIQAVARLEERIQEIDKDILKKEDAAIEENVDLKLTYIVNNASWEPTYELHATTQNGKPSSTVMLNYRALISQRTGEDWADAKLTLSTSNTSMNTTIPSLPSIKIRSKSQASYTSTSTYSAPVAALNPSLSVAFGGFGQLSSSQPTVARSASGSSGFGFSQAQAVPAFSGSAPLFGGPRPTGTSDSAAESQPTDNLQVGTTSFRGGGAALDQEESFHPLPATVVRDSALSVSYSVQGAATIPSDGLSHMVSVADLEFDSQIKYVAVPRVESIVYLQCEVKNTSEYRLLPGTVGVILDESFVSQTSILDVPAGDTFTCTLGVDPATKITYSRRTTHSATKRSTFVEGRRTTSYTVSISITNKHGFGLEDVLVKEVLPMAEISEHMAVFGRDNSKAQVLLKKPLGLAEGKSDEAFTLDGSKADAESTVPASMLVRWSKAEPGGQSGDKEGKFEWLGRLDEGQNIELEAAWDVKSSEDVQWTEVSV